MPGMLLTDTHGVGLKQNRVFRRFVFVLWTDTTLPAVICLN